MAATPLPRFDRATLARWLAAASGASGVEIAAIELLPGGAIQENWRLDAVFADGPLAGKQHLVLRTDAATGVPGSLGRVEEFAVLQAVSAAGVSVPEPLWACADPSVLGKPFFIMRRVAGSAQGRWITTDPALEPALPDIAARVARELALIQTIRPPRHDLAFLPTIGPEEHVAAFRDYLDRHPRPRPVLEWATRWLETHVPEPLPPVLCHRDFRTGNYMLDIASGGTALTGTLDWEFAGWGDPDEDIGWFCCKGWRFARLDREAGGIVRREAFYRAYEKAASRRLNPERVRFWEVLANVRWAVIALQQSDRCLVGGARDLSTAIIGRRATECDLELLILLDPNGAARTAPSPPPRERVGVRGRISERSSPSLSRIVGEGQILRDLPSGVHLLSLGREWLVDELLPLVPAERHRELRLIATAMAIAEREAAAGDAAARNIRERLTMFYGQPASCRRDTGGPDIGDLLRRLAGDLRNGAFEACERREAAARAILWALTVSKLREGNPQFLAENGFGE